MVMIAPWRRFTLTAHIVTSAGWLGAVIVFIVLAVTALTSPDLELVAAVYRVMEPAARYALVPLAAASLLTGLIQSLGSAWGLWRHYWVICKLVINIGALLLLLAYLKTLSFLADVAAVPVQSEADLAVLRSPTVLLHAVLAAALLLLATGLAVYKPKGMTRYGWRRSARA